MLERSVFLSFEVGLFLSYGVNIAGISCTSCVPFYHPNVTLPLFLRSDSYRFHSARASCAVEIIVVTLEFPSEHQSGTV